MYAGAGSCVCKCVCVQVYVLSCLCRFCPHRYDRYMENCACLVQGWVCTLATCSAALPMPLRVISVLAYPPGWGWGGHLCRSLAADSAHSEAHVCPGQDFPSSAWLSGSLLPPPDGSSSQRRLRLLFFNHSLVPADSGCSGI